MSIPLIYQDDVAETIIVKRTQRIHIPYDENISYFCHIKEFMESSSSSGIWILQEIWTGTIL